MLLGLERDVELRKIEFIFEDRTLCVAEDKVLGVVFKKGDSL